MPVPWDETQVIYVWIDALLNYYTALSYAREGEDLTDRFWPATVHLIGKDILKFHAVIWPALLMAAGIEVPRRVGIHGYLLLGEHKMSKSLGNVIDPFQVIDVYGADALRFYVLREVSFGQDGEVSPEGFETRYTTELANEYGNLASRTLAMIGRYRDGVVPEAEPARELAAEFDGLAEAVRASASTRSSSPPALDEIWQRVSALNRYVQDEEPWKLAKDDGAGRAARPGALRARRGPARGLGAAAPVHARARPSGCSPRSAARTARSTARASARSAAARTIGELGPALPARRAARAVGGLSAPGAGPSGRGRHPLPPRRCEPPDAELVERAREAGLTPARHGRDGRRLDRARARGGARARRGVRDRRPPPARDRRLRRARTSRRSSARRPTRARARSARPASTTTATTRRATTSAAPSRRRSSWPRALRLPLVIHTRAAEDDTFAMLREHADRLPAVILHCFSAPDRARRVRRARLPLLVRRQRHLPEGDRPPGGRARGAGRAAAGRDRLARTSRRSPCAASRTSRPTWSTRPSYVADAARHVLRGARARPSRRNAARVFGW